jgi:hypothetical protein
VFVSALIVGLAVSFVSIDRPVADDASKIEADPKNPGQLKLPDDITVVDDKTKGKKFRAACDKCPKEGDALKAALAAYYAAQSADGYSGKGPDAKAREKAGNDGLENILGLSKAEKTAAVKKYNEAKKSKSKKDNDSVTTDQLLKNINDALKALRDCEAEKCPKKAEPPKEKEKETKEEKVVHWPGFDDLPGNVSDANDIKKTVDWFKSIKLPTCSDDKAKTKKEIEQLIKDMIEAESYIAIGFKVGKLEAATKAASDTIKGIKAKLDVEGFLEKIDQLPGCGGGMYFPGTPFGGGQTYAVTYFDSGEECTFGRSEPVSAPLTPTDANFDPLPPGDQPADTPKTPTPIAPMSPVADRPIETAKAPPEEPKPPVVSETPKTPTEEPKTPAEEPKTPTTADKPEEPKKPEQPTTTTEKLPETPVTTNEATPTDEIVILFKGNQEVLERGQTGEPLKGEHVMLVFRKPDHRESGTGKPAKDDSGFNKDGVRGVTGADGQAKLMVPAEDRALYLSSLGDRPNRYYRIDGKALKNTGGVSEVTRNTQPDLTAGAPQGGRIKADTFKIGDRTFVRRLYMAPYGFTVVFLRGEKLDECLIVEPARGLNAEPENPSALHLELPEATITLLPTRRQGRIAR